MKMEKDISFLTIEVSLTGLSRSVLDQTSSFTDRIALLGKNRETVLCLKETFER